MNYSHKTIVCDGKGLAANGTEIRQESPGARRRSRVAAPGVGTFSLLQLLRLLRLLGHQSGLVWERLAHQAVGSGVGGYQGRGGDSR